MNARKLVATAALAALSVVGFAGVASANVPTKTVPGPCNDPISMPEYCNPVEPNQPLPGEKPTPDNTWFSIGNQDDELEGQAAEPTSPRPTRPATVRRA